VIDEDLGQLRESAARVVRRHGRITDHPKVRPVPGQGAVRRIDHQPHGERKLRLTDRKGEMEIAERTHAGGRVDEQIGGGGVEHVLERRAHHDVARKVRDGGLGLDRVGLVHGVLWRAGGPDASGPAPRPRCQTRSPA